ncbi:hypothetical protein BD847_2503 [Flavobacterium cutihirudinis]|uniref:Surface-adhesin protein E-like domain-containing protein n=1 Tax=Flavobacterium cutihirudinis TaxID=1265740 RepID=A0A3D9FSK4_9FLAO|nr:surface-adhesin E family protein [Flavobacterium cutihirudinis]RED23450.1 hypothetical protein BD847_2503 [Flavobacterium cutihirudinis]
MKKLFLLITFFAFSFAYSQDWKLLFELPDAGSYYYKSNTNETAWIKVVSDKIKYYSSKTSREQKSVDGYSVSLWKFDCRSKKMGIIKSTTYNKDGKVLESFSQNELLVEMDYVNPDSIGEGLLITFCGT